jgi:preprotein translocase subunit SecB
MFFGVFFLIYICRMLEPKKAAFSFSGFSFPKFSYTEAEEPGLNIQIDPNGNYYQKEGAFILTVRFVGLRDNSEKDVIVELTGMATFNFHPEFPFSEIPEFFYNNCLAIFFPYIRAFLSTMTLQANTKLLILDLSNLTNLAEHLKKNTECHDSLSNNS